MSDDEFEFLAFVDADGPSLRGLALLLAGNEHDAADLYQETLIAVFSSWSSIRAKGALRAYARTVMTRRFISTGRRSWVRRVVLTEPSESPAVPGGGTTAVDDATSLAGALTSLSPQQRAVVVLRFYCDQSEADIARLLECTTGTVKTHTSRALARLRLDPGLTDAYGRQS